MCGRFVAGSPPLLLAEHFGVDEIRVDDVPPSWNVAPTDRVLAIAEHAGRRLLGSFRWGLVPSWAKDDAGGARMINARAETLGEKPAFREAFARRRCIVPADGFYEWRLTTGGRKQPVLIAHADRTPLALAGLWEVWRDPTDGARTLKTCTIVTTAANATLSGLHDRMPVVLPSSAWATWLDPAEHDLGLLGSLLVPAPDDALDLHDASLRVNDVRNKDESVLVP